MVFAQSIKVRRMIERFALSDLIELAPALPYREALEKSIGTALELQLLNDEWVRGTLEWTPEMFPTAQFFLYLGGEHERHGTPGPFLTAKIDVADCYFRWPAGASN